MRERRTNHGLPETEAGLEDDLTGDEAGDARRAGETGQAVPSPWPSDPSIRSMSPDTQIPPPLHQLEEAVMEAVWAREETCVRDVMEALNAAGKTDRAYTTYMTIMARLDNKGLLVRTRRGKTDFYRAVYSRDRYADLRAGAAIDSIVDQFGDVALTHLARQMAQLSPQHRRSLERLARRK